MAIFVRPQNQCPSTSDEHTMAWMHLASPEYSYLILKGCSHTLTEQGPDILFC